MSKKKLTAFDGIQLVGIHKEPTFGPRENKKNPYEYCKEHKTISVKTTAGCPFCLQAENKRLREAMVGDSPFPLLICLEELADAADHLLDDHQCDKHGYELVAAAKAEARLHILRITQALKE